MLNNQLIRLLVVVNLLAAAVFIFQWRADQVNALSNSNNDRVGLLHKSILLVSETRGDAAVTRKPGSVAEAAQLVRSGTLSESASDPITVNPVCIMLGPYFSLSNARSAANSAGLDDDWIESEDFTDDKVDYRVHIAPASSIEEAYRTLKLLRSNSIDSFVMTDGPLARGISLGVFSSRESAKRFRMQSSLIVFKPVVAPISRIQRSHWLKLEHKDRDILDKIAARIITQSLPDKISVRPVCQ
jgi:hypothetical protein